jgi:hypothetical protein
MGPEAGQGGGIVRDPIVKPPPGQGPGQEGGGGKGENIGRPGPGGQEVPGQKTSFEQAAQRLGQHKLNPGGTFEGQKLNQSPLPGQVGPQGQLPSPMPPSASQFQNAAVYNKVVTMPAEVLAEGGTALTKPPQEADVGRAAAELGWHPDAPVDPRSLLEPPPGVIVPEVQSVIEPPAPMPTQAPVPMQAQNMEQRRLEEEARRRNKESLFDFGSVSSAITHAARVLSGIFDRGTGKKADDEPSSIPGIWLAVGVVGAAILLIAGIVAMVS